MLELLQKPSQRPETSKDRQSKKAIERQLRKTDKQKPNNIVATIKTIKPLTKNQRIAFEEYNKGQNLVMIGNAGTGKSFLGCYLAMDEILNKKTYEKLVIVRSTVELRPVGHLPRNFTTKNSRI